MDTGLCPGDEWDEATRGRVEGGAAQGVGGGRQRGLSPFRLREVVPGQGSLRPNRRTQDGSTMRMRVHFPGARGASAPLGASRAVTAPCVGLQDSAAPLLEPAHPRFPYSTSHHLVTQFSCERLERVAPWAASRLHTCLLGRRQRAQLAAIILGLLSYSGAELGAAYISFH